jgi:hypothetical protein
MYSKPSLTRINWGSLVKQKLGLKEKKKNSEHK